MATVTLNCIAQKSNNAARMQLQCKQIDMLTKLLSASLNPIGAQDFSHLCYFQLKIAALHCNL